MEERLQSETEEKAEDMCIKVLTLLVSYDPQSVAKASTGSLLLGGGLPVEVTAQVSPLHLAVFFCTEKVVECVLRLKGDPNAQDSRGETPLMYAAREGSAPESAVLLKYGADPSLGNIDNEFPLGVSSNEEVNKMLTIQLNQWLLAAAGGGSVEEVGRILQAKGDANAQDSSGRTPLMWSIDCLRLPTSMLLLDSGKADANIRRNDGKTALHVVMASSKASDRMALVRALIFHEANVNATCDSHSTPLHEAILMRDAMSIEFLLERKGDPQIVDCCGSSCNDLALECCEPVIVKLLLPDVYERAMQASAEEEPAEEGDSSVSAGEPTLLNAHFNKCSCTCHLLQQV